MQAHHYIRSFAHRDPVSVDQLLKVLILVRTIGNCFNPTEPHFSHPEPVLHSTPGSSPSLPIRRSTHYSTLKSVSTNSPVYPPQITDPTPLFAAPFEQCEVKQFCKLLRKMTTTNLEADPEARKVREWRYKLQKALLGSKSAPSDEEMPALDQLFMVIELYDHPNLINFISSSKIDKVMRHIAVLTPDKVPRDEEFQFRARAKALVDKWHAILGANKPTEKGGAGETTINGAPTDTVPDASKARTASPPG